VEDVQRIVSYQRGREYCVDFAHRASLGLYPVLNAVRGKMKTCTNGQATVMTFTRVWQFPLTANAVRAANAAAAAAAAQAGQAASKEPVVFSPAELDASVLAEALGYAPVGKLDVRQLEACEKRLMEVSQDEGQWTGEGGLPVGSW
jgi:hypothetical protein